MPDIRRRTKVPGPNGQLIDAEQIDVTDSKEPWSEYHLDDGSTLKIKQVLLEVWRLVDQYDPDGNPVYFIKGSPVMNVIAPQIMKKKK